MSFFELGWRYRSYAAVVHLFFSALVVFSLAALLIFVWFPYPFREISGGQSLFWMVVWVDVILGPFLTWVVFDRRKPRAELLCDLAVIGLLQFSALAFGLWSAYHARPVYLVHEVDRFVVISAADVDPSDLQNAMPGFQKLPFFGVKAIGVRESRDAKERLYSFELALVGKDVSMRPEYWQPLSDANRKSIRHRAKPLPILMDRSAKDRVIVTSWLNEIHRKPDELVYLPITARDKVWTALIDVNSLDIVGYLPIDSF